MSRLALFIPTIDAAIADARARKLESPGPFTYPLLERLFLRMSGAAAEAAHPRADGVRTDGR